MITFAHITQQCVKVIYPKYYKQYLNVQNVGSFSNAQAYYPYRSQWYIQSYIYTIVDGGPGVKAKIFGVLGPKICYFIKENMAGNGPLVFRTVLCLNLGQKLVFSERNG